MSNIQLYNVSDPYLPEPKGISTAASGTVYVATGSGSGAWTPRFNQFILELSLPDIGNADTTYVVVPRSGTLTTIYFVADAAAGGASTALSFSNNGTAITNSGITVSSAYTAGTVLSSTPSALNTFSAGAYVSFASDGGTTSTGVRGRVTLLFTAT